MTEQDLLVKARDTLGWALINIRLRYGSRDSYVPKGDIDSPNVGWIAEQALDTAMPWWRDL